MGCASSGIKQQDRISNRVAAPMIRAKRLLARTGLAGTTIAMLAMAACLQLTVHDPRHVLLTALGSWGLLSLPIGLLVGHCALSED